MPKKAAADPKKKPGRKLVVGDPTLTQAENAAIKAIKDFEVAEKVIDLFKIDNSKVLKEYSELLEEWEQKRQVADAAIRSCDASFGPWRRFSEQKKYFPELLYQHLGKEKFLAIGGTIKQQPVYEIEPPKIEIAITTGAIPAAVVPDVRKITPKYRSPKSPDKD